MSLTALPRGAFAQLAEPNSFSGPENVLSENPAEATVPVAVSPAVAEVIRLAQSGVGEEVVLAYVQNSDGGFDLSSDQILYLRDLGISSPVISAMLNRDAMVRNEPSSQPAVPPPTAPTVPVEAPLTPLNATEIISPPPQVNYFYSSLSPYGSWVDLDGVGWCWQPTVVVVNRTWQPYCDSGHWVYTDAGWFWRSDYSWGWAPFHYGRWYNHPRCGWVWTPDRVWAPAWVVWRSGGDRCGWAPLPPRATFDVHAGWTFNGVRVRADFDFGLKPNNFTFVGLHNFNDRDIRHHRLPPTEVTKIYKNTTIVNNYTVNNTTIVNRGVPVERVASVARTPVRRATVREVAVDPGNLNIVSRSAEKETVVYRPVLKEAPKTTQVAIQKVDNRNPVIRHTPSVRVANQSRGETIPAANTGRRGQRESVVPGQNIQGGASSTSPGQEPTTTSRSTRTPQSQGPINTRPTRQPDGRTETRPSQIPTPTTAPTPSQSPTVPTPSQTPNRPERSAPTRTAPQQQKRAVTADSAAPTPPTISRVPSVTSPTVPTRPIPEPVYRVPGNSGASSGRNPHNYEPKGYYQSREYHGPPSKSANPPQSRGNASNPKSNNNDSKSNKNSGG
jgi:hypothetical protein